MRKAVVKYNGIKAGMLSEEESGEYVFVYDEEYRKNHPDLFITFSMPVSKQIFRSKKLFPFFSYVVFLHKSMVLIS